MKEVAAKNIVLVGFMGTGKTVVSKLLAAALKRKLFDTDDLIVLRENMPITDIFSLKGEAYFRKLESEIVQEVSRQSGLIIATGGGVVLNPQNVAVLQKSGFLVWLDASIEALRQRLANDKSRPLLSKEGSLSALYQQRKDYYRRAAHVRIDTTGKSPAVVADEILALQAKFT
ncbi:MAG: shikimate kinase [Firmicutes bacterium]|nr:shikimate kinase [Bacillota bacterium]